MNATEMWIDEVLETEDIALRTHRVTLTYYDLSTAVDDGARNSWFTFAVWSTLQIGKIIRDDGISERLSPWLRALTTRSWPELAHHLAEGQRAVLSDVVRHSWVASPWDNYTIMLAEQRIVDPYIRRAMDAPADMWGLRDGFCRYVTRRVLGVELPTETLYAGERIPSTLGDAGRAVKDYRDYSQRTRWLEGLLATREFDRTLTLSPYTAQDAERIRGGSMPCEGRWAE
jgi:hypothetical protein